MEKEQKKTRKPLLKVTCDGVRGIFYRYCEVMGVKFGHQPNHYHLEYLKPKNGYMVIQYNYKGEEVFPFGSGRRGANEMYRCLEFAIYTMLHKAELDKKKAQVLKPEPKKRKS